MANVGEFTMTEAVTDSEEAAGEREFPRAAAAAAAAGGLAMGGHARAVLMTKKGEGRPDGREKGDLVTIFVEIGGGFI